MAADRTAPYDIWCKCLRLCETDKTKAKISRLLTSDANVHSLVIGREMHDLFQHRRRQPRCECANMQQIAEHQRVYDSSHRNLLQRNRTEHGFDAIVMQFPVDFNGCDDRVGENSRTRIQIERQSTNECG